MRRAEAVGEKELLSKHAATSALTSALTFEGDGEQQGQKVGMSDEAPNGGTKKILSIRLIPPSPPPLVTPTMQRRDVDPVSSMGGSGREIESATKEPRGDTSSEPSSVAHIKKPLGSEAAWHHHTHRGGASPREEKLGALRDLGKLTTSSGQIGGGRGADGKPSVANSRARPAADGAGPGVEASSGPVYTRSGKGVERRSIRGYDDRIYGVHDNGFSSITRTTPQGRLQAGGALPSTASSPLHSTSSRAAILSAHPVAADGGRGDDDSAKVSGHQNVHANGRALLNPVTLPVSHREGRHEREKGADGRGKGKGDAGSVSPERESLQSLQVYNASCQTVESEVGGKEVWMQGESEGGKENENERERQREKKREQEREREKEREKARARERVRERAREFERAREQEREREHEMMITSRRLEREREAKMAEARRAEEEAERRRARARARERERARV